MKAAFARKDRHAGPLHEEPGLRSRNPRARPGPGGHAGLFRLVGAPQEALEPFLVVEAPRILFPFARRVIADAVRDGGFPPLMLEPIDFGGLYLQQLEARGDGFQPMGNA